MTTNRGRPPAQGVAMETVQIRLPRQHIKVLDKLVKAGVYPNRSEAVRDSVRKMFLMVQRAGALPAAKQEGG